MVFTTKKQKKKSGKGIFDIVKTIASNPIAKLAGNELKKKMIELAVNKSTDFVKKKLTKKGSGVKRSKKMNSGGVPSYNKNAVVTVTKPMKEIKNAIKPARKKDFFM